MARKRRWVRKPLHTLLRQYVTISEIYLKLTNNIQKTKFKIKNNFASYLNTWLTPSLTLIPRHGRIFFSFNLFFFHFF
jgi:hypothetical protein